MDIINNFTKLFGDVWGTGLGGVNFSEVFFAIIIFLLFLLFRGLFSKIIIARLENFVSKTSNQFDGNTNPLNVISPVIATFLSTGMSVIAETIEVTIPTPAEGPSFGVAPSGT